jgi:integrase
MTDFTSSFAGKLDAMLLFRVAHGYKRETHLARLIRFDKYCANHFPQIHELTREIVHAWLDNESESVIDLAGAAGTIRQFGKYLNATGEDAYVLPDKFTPYKKRSAPYIFTDAEVTALFDAIDKLPDDKNEHFLTEISPVLFRLIYTCGLRPNEGRELLTENVSLDNGEIIITHTKKNKERMVVMSDDMLEMCQRYELRRRIFGNQNPYFFPAINGHALSAAKILATLSKAWVSATCTANNPIQHSIRVYDLRHRFASACLNRWLDEGQDLMRMLPYLRVYMGHDKLSETAYYIHILPENLTKSAAIDWDVFNAMFPEVAE